MTYALPGQCSNSSVTTAQSGTNVDVPWVPTMGHVSRPKFKALKGIIKHSPLAISHASSSVQANFLLKQSLQVLREGSAPNFAPAGMRPTSKLDNSPDL